MNEIKELKGKTTGNEKFDNIYLNSRDRVYKTALYYTKRADVAEEILQDAFLEMYIKIDEINPETAENWLLRVAKNKAVNWSMRSSKETEKIETLEESTGELMSRDVADKFFAKEHNRKLGDLSKEIFTELRKENENWYEAVMRVYGMERPQKEVASEMNVSIEVLHATLYRARKWIKRKYGEKYTSLFGL